jgi:hypothetical protein
MFRSNLIFYSEKTCESLNFKIELWFQHISLDPNFLGLPDLVQKAWKSTCQNHNHGILQRNQVETKLPVRLPNIIDLGPYSQCSPKENPKFFSKIKGNYLQIFLFNIYHCIISLTFKNKNKIIIFITKLRVLFKRKFLKIVSTK